jgi:hypothetical protein
VAVGARRPERRGRRGGLLLLLLLRLRWQVGAGLALLLQLQGLEQRGQGLRVRVPWQLLHGLVPRLLLL